LNKATIPPTILLKAMRRLLLTCLLTALAVPAVALSAGTLAGDGMLAVRSATAEPGQAVVNLTMTGAVIGQVDRGRVVIDELAPGAGGGIVVTGAERQRDLSSTATLYVGTDIRFRAVGGKYHIRISGSGVDVNAVGQGSVRLQGTPFLLSDGSYSLNGGDWISMPDAGATFTIGA
jgi:hypothetical protein